MLRSDKIGKKALDHGYILYKTTGDPRFGKCTWVLVKTTIPYRNLYWDNSYAIHLCKTLDEVERILNFRL